MAESYRGLTIRIGGDTTKLNQALHTANQAITGTQSSMKKLSDALKMDPSSLRASQLQIGAFAEQASNAATRLVTLNDAMRQVGEHVQTFHGATSTVREMAESWGNVSMKAAEARDYYAELTKTIATNYTELSKLNKEAASYARNEFKSGFNIDETSFDSMKELVALVDGSKAGINKQLDSLKEMQAQYLELKNSYADYQHLVATSADQKTFVEAAQKLTEIRTRMGEVKTAFAEAAKELKDVKFKGIEFTFDKKNVDLESLKTGLQQAVAASKLTQEEADKLYEKYASLKEMFKEAWSDVQTANQVEGFKDLEAEAAKAEAKVKSVVDELVRLAQTTETARGLVTLQQQLDGLTSKSEEARNRLSVLLTAITESMKLNGGNASEGLVNGAMQEYATIVETTRLKIANLQEQISHYTDEEVIALANSTKSLAADTEAATEKFREQETILTGYQAGLDDLQIKMDKIAASDPVGNNDTDAIEQYKEYYKQWFDIHNAMQQTKESAAEARAEMTKFVDATDLREKNQQLAQEEQTLDKISKINYKPEVDVSSVEGLRKAVEAINNGLYDAKGSNKFGDVWDFSKAAENIRIANTALDAAKNKFKELSTATKNDPTNSATMSAAMQAAQQYATKLEAAIRAYREQIDSIPADKIDQTALATGKVTEAFEAAKAKVAEFDKKIDETEKQIQALTAERKSIVPTNDNAEEIANLDNRIKNLKASLKDLQAQAAVALDELATEDNTRRVEEAQTKSRTLRAELQQVREEAKKLGETDGTPKIDEAAFMQVVDRIAQAARQMASEIVQASNEVDSAYRDMRKTVNGTEEDFERLKDAATEYSKSSFTSADQMLEMQALGGQLGVAVENLEQFGRIASNLDIATDIDAETVALKLGQISNILGLDIEGMQGFSDALVRLGNNMPAQESAIMAVAQRFGAVAATASFSGDEVLGWSAAIAATGQRSEAAATAISNTVSGIEQAVANGGSDLKQFAAIAGMSADEFVQSWKDSPTETLRAFIEGLKTLKDSDESAVAALENMGITGVRQQQTLLSLTQTIDSLDDALLMSKNAWNGVNDQWGQSGDAANEAQKKAEGFSGALQILKNNVQNLAASLGDGMVEPMRVIAEVIGHVTDVLNNMPQPIKEIVVALGAAGIAFSALTPMFNSFVGGWANMINAAKGATTIAEFISKLSGFDKVATAFSAATEGATGFAAVLSGPMVLGIGAVAIALTALYSYLTDFQKEQDMLWEATEGLTNSIFKMKEAYDGYVPDSAILSVSELRDRTNEVIESQASLAEQMGEKWADVGVQAAMVDEFANKIVELSEKTALTVDEQKELEAAVESYNDLTGSSIQIVDALTGELDTSTDSILENADAWKERAESEAAFEMYKDVVKQRIKDEMALADAEETLKKAEEDAKGSAIDLYGGISMGNIEVAKAQAEYDKLKGALDESSAAEEQLVGHMLSSEKAIQRVRDVLVEAGVSTEEFDSLTKEQMADIAKNCNLTADDIIKAIDRIKQATNDLAAGTAEALDDASKASAKAAADAYKVEADAEYNRTKADFDAAYKEAQRGYKEIYNARKTALDSQYNALKRSLDAEYNERKRQYDRQYSSLKNKLDSEERALKASNDAKLKALKYANDAEEREYKNATEAYLHELEKRYKAAVKEAEDETDAKVKAIDEQIRALKLQTTAEQNAIKEMKEDDKIAELQKAVDQAKSRRKREEAEKKLNEYLLEVQADRNERERKSQIEELEQEKKDLKDALDARKDELKASYDEDKYNYKTMREEKLDEIKLANDLEYDALKVKLDNEEALQKERNDAQLEKLKERQSIRLETIKANHTEELQALKDAQELELQQLQEGQSIALEQLKAGQTATLQQMKVDQQARYDQIKNGQDEEEKSQDESNKKKLKNETDHGAARTAAQNRYLSAMEARMQEAGDKNVKSVSESNDEINKDSDDKLSALAQMYKTRGEDSTNWLAGAFASGESYVGENAQTLANTALAPFGGMPGEMYTNGWDMLVEFNNGLVKAWNSGGSLRESIENIAQYIRDRWGFSVPKYGPMSDADKWGPDMVYLIADGIKDKQHVLIRQVEKLSDAMEEAFDPTLSVDAAYEALDTIGKKRTASLGAIVETNSAPSVTINLSMNLADVSIRSDADIERLARVLSQEMATQATRQLAGRLG